jgi:hypothetical protein
MPRMNQTGMKTAPGQSAALLETVPKQVHPPTEADQAALMAMRGAYVTGGDPIGSVPPPLSVKGVVETVKGMVTAEQPTVLMDKLGERLAFERTGVRLYDAMIHKVRAGARGGSLPIEDLQHIRDEELEHFHLVHRAIEQLGGDPTAVTPAADVAGVMSIGIVQVLADPRTSTDECLCALLTAERSDNDGWELLIQLMRGMGHAELAGQFETALAHEAEHAARVRSWIANRTTAAAGIG